MSFDVFQEVSGNFREFEGHLKDFKVFQGVSGSFREFQGFLKNFQGVSETSSQGHIISKAF